MRPFQKLEKCGGDEYIANFGQINTMGPQMRTRITPEGGGYTVSAYPYLYILSGISTGCMLTFDRNGKVPRL
jgi:hypothetical protein